MSEETFENFSRVVSFGIAICCPRSFFDAGTHTHAEMAIVHPKRIGGKIAEDSLKHIYITWCTAQEASWMRGLDPIYTHLFDLYHQLCSKVLFQFVPLTRAPGFICTSFQCTGSTPAGFQEVFRAVYE